jgi:hypothetical protein
MGINSAQDHGFQMEPFGLDVAIGDTFRQCCALGISEYEVWRRHRDVGYFECVFRRWVTDVPDFRQGFVNSIRVFSRAQIIDAMRAA